MTNIILINPPVSFKRNAWKKEIIPSTPHLGLLYIAGALEDYGFSVKIIDAADGSYSIEDIAKVVKEEHAQLIGITSMTMNIRGAVQLAKELKEKQGSIKIILGGPHLSADPTIIKRYPFFDIGITGEADITFANLAISVVEKQENISGIYSGEIPFNLDDISFPAYHLIDFEQYRKRGFWANLIMASRGCPYHCIFCSIPAISKKVRFRSPKNIINEMEKVYELTQSKYFGFVDDAFTVKKSFIFKLCDEMKNLSFKPIWDAATRVDYINHDLLRAMKEAGCSKLFFGVESGSERIRNEVIKKNVTDEQIKLATQLCWKNGIEPNHFLMLGFPTESIYDINKTVNCPSEFKPNAFNINITQPLPGSPLFELAVSEGIIEKDAIDKYIDGVYGDTYNEGWPKYIPKGVTYEYLLRARDIAYKKYYFRPRYITRRLIRDIKSISRLKYDMQNALSLIFKGKSINDYTKEI